MATKVPLDITALAKRLVAIRTDPDCRPALSAALKLVTSQVAGFQVEKFERNGARSILVHNAPKGTRHFKVILNGHLDVIPGKDHQYRPRIRGNKLHGVGSMDMKGNVASLIAAFREAAPLVNYPLALQIVTDEEIGGFDGTKLQVDRGVRAEFVIAGETTQFNIVNRAKGVLWLKISCRGKTAHGAYPWRGENAITKMTAFLDGLTARYPVPDKQVWGTTINVAKIETSNQTFNKIPDSCEAWLDIRYVPGKGRPFLAEVRKLLPRGFELAVVADEPALNVEEKNFYLQRLKRSTEKVLKKKIIFYGAQGSSDARHYARVNCPGVEFGPVGGGIGTDREWVDLKSLRRFQAILVEFLTSLNRQGVTHA